MDLHAQFEQTTLVSQDATYRVDSDEYVWKDYPSTTHPVTEQYEAFQDGYRLAHEEAMPPGYVRADLILPVIEEAEARLEGAEGNAPGHAHVKPGFWDESGQQCEWCRKWGLTKIILQGSGND